MSIKKIEGENYKIPDNARVKIIDLGDTLQIKNSWISPNNLKQFKKYNKNYCIDEETGELIKYHNSNLLKNKTSIKNSMQKLFQIIKLNFTGKDNEIFLTLTCDSPVYELSKIKKYKELFIRRLKRKFKDSKFCYVYKFEQKKEKTTGKYTWHCHILLKDLSRKILYLDNDEIITPLWKKGFTRTERVLPDIKQSIASYMAKTTQLNQVKNGEKIYGMSRNIKKPIITKKIYKDVKDEINEKCNFESERTILIIDENTNKIINKHKTETYQKRKDTA